MSEDLHHVLRQQLQDFDAGWSIGSFGTIGEFHQRPSDVLEQDDPDRLSGVVALIRFVAYLLGVVPSEVS
ncbi:MAG: hypothetical protein ABJF90_00135 [Lentilitoribacter sp.]